MITEEHIHLLEDIIAQYQVIFQVIKVVKYLKLD